MNTRNRGAPLAGALLAFLAAIPALAAAEDAETARLIQEPRHSRVGGRGARPAGLEGSTEGRRHGRGCRAHRLPAAGGARRHARGRARARGRGARGRGCGCRDRRLRGRRHPGRAEDPLDAAPLRRRRALPCDPGLCRPRHRAHQHAEGRRPRDVRARARLHVRPCARVRRPTCRCSRKANGRTKPCPRAGCGRSRGARCWSSASAASAPRPRSARKRARDESHRDPQFRHRRAAVRRGSGPDEGPARICRARRRHRGHAAADAGHERPLRQGASSMPRSAARSSSTSAAAAPS